MNTYYVYAYLRRKDNTPYYIGKGKRRRCYDRNHKVPVPTNKNLIKFYHTTLTNEDASKLEISYIKLFGRKDQGTGILRNRTDGGDGGNGNANKGKKRNPLSEEIKFLRQQRMEMLGTTQKGKTRGPQKNPRKILSNEEREILYATRTGQKRNKGPNSKLRTDIGNKRGKQLNPHNGPRMPRKDKGIKRK